MPSCLKIADFVPCVEQWKDIFPGPVFVNCQKKREMGSENRSTKSSGKRPIAYDLRQCIKIFVGLTL